MTLAEYQKQARRTATFPPIGASYVYPTLGLASEAGEVASKVKKIFRDQGGVLDEAHREEILRELGDVLWYVAALATELNAELDDVAVENLTKLASRQSRGVIKGEGDSR